jgi:4-hydroxy-2-oxoheptanedioate aldolase
MTELRAAGAAAVLADGGFEFVFIDLEHGAYELDNACRLIQAGKAAGICPLPRVPLTAAGLFARLLDCGAEGVLVPQVRTMADVQQAVNLSKYPPVGRRGLHFLRPHSGFKVPADAAAYLDAANRSLLTLVQIETAEAVELIPEIAASEGVDGLYVGPGDLSVNLGQPDGLRQHELEPVLRAVGAACKAHGKIAGYHFHDAAEVRRCREYGFSMFGYSCALRLLMNGVRQLHEQL